MRVVAAKMEAALAAVQALRDASFEPATAATVNFQAEATTITMLLCEMEQL